MKERITIVGSGMMGSGICASAVLAGHEVVLYDLDKVKTEDGMRNCFANIDQIVKGGLADEDSGVTAKSLVSTSIVLEDALRDSTIVIEAATEDLRLKQKIFRQLDELTDSDVILTSNTSGLRITDIVLETKNPERTATTHFWYPAHLVLLVEIVLGQHTNPDVGERLRKLFSGWGKAPVVVTKDLPGQLANRILQAVIREAVHIVETGLASPEDVDTAIKAGMALRFPVWGPLEHIDGVGLDLALSVQRDVIKDLSNSTTPSQYLEQLCSDGKLGYKSGNGIYDWSKKNMQKLSKCRDNFIIQTVKLLKDLKENNICE